MDSGGVDSRQFRALREQLRLTTLERDALGLLFERQAPTGLDQLRADLADVLDVALAAFRAERGFLLVFTHPQALHPHEILSVGRSEQGGSLRPSWQALSRSVVERVRSSRSPQLLSDAAREGPFQEQASVQQLKLRSVLCIPLRAAGGAPRAVVYLENRTRAQAFSSRRERRLRPLMERLALWLERKLAGFPEFHGTDYTERWRQQEFDFSSLLGTSEAWGRVLERLVELGRVPPARLWIHGPAGSGRGTVARSLAQAWGDARARPRAWPSDEGALRQLVDEHQGRVLILRGLDERPVSDHARLMRALERCSHTPRLVCTALTPPGVLERDRRLDPSLALGLGSLELPSLASRPADVVAIAQETIALQGAFTLSGAAEERLTGYDWPGEVRELLAVITDAVHQAARRQTGNQDRVESTDLRLPEARDAGAEGLNWDQGHERFRRQLLGRAMSAAEGHIERASELLGISRQYLSRLLRQHGLYHLRSNSRGRKPRAP